MELCLLYPYVFSRRVQRQQTALFSDCKTLQHVSASVSSHLQGVSIQRFYAACPVSVVKYVSLYCPVSVVKYVSLYCPVSVVK